MVQDLFWNLRTSVSMVAREFTIRRIEKKRIVVTGLDAFDGTPVIDLKHSQKLSMR